MANGSGGKVTPLDLTSWFADYTALTTIDVTNLDVSKAVSFDKMFQNAKVLTTITGMGGWKTDSGISFQDMFANVEKLESLDLSGVYTATGSGSNVADGTEKNRLDMLAGMKSLRTITLHPDTALTDTGIERISSRNDDLGYWMATRVVQGEINVWQGKPSELIQRWGTNGAADNGLKANFTLNFFPEG